MKAGLGGASARDDKCVTARRLIVSPIAKARLRRTREKRRVYRVVSGTGPKPGSCEFAMCVSFPAACNVRGDFRDTKSALRRARRWPHQPVVRLARRRRAWCGAPALCEPQMADYQAPALDQKRHEASTQEGP